MCLTRLQDMTQARSPRTTIKTPNHGVPNTPGLHCLKFRLHQEYPTHVNLRADVVAGNTLYPSGAISMSIAQLHRLQSIYIDASQKKVGSLGNFKLFTKHDSHSTVESTTKKADRHWRKRFDSGGLAARFGFDSGVLFARLNSTVARQGWQRRTGVGK